MGAHREGYKEMGASVEGQRDRDRARTPPCMIVCTDLTRLEHHSQIWMGAMMTMPHTAQGGECMR